VPHQRAGIDIPNGWDFVTIEIKLRGFRGTPVGADLRELADDQRLDVRLLGLFVIEVGANISDVRVS
jgi:hypothetical protein